MNLEMLYNFVLALAGVLLVAAAISDARAYRIPNSICAALLALFPFYVYAAPVTVHWAQHLAVFGAFLAAGYLLFLKNYAGAGDIKLLSTAGLWAGPDHALTLLFVTAFAGGVLALGFGALSVFRHIRSAKTDGSEGGEGAPRTPFAKIPLPYGVAIAVGGLCALALLAHPDVMAAKV